MRYVLKISDIWYWTACNPGLGDRTEAQCLSSSTESRIPRCLEIEVVYGHFTFPGAAVDAARRLRRGGEPRSLRRGSGAGSFSARREQRAAMPVPHQLETPLASVRSAAFGGADRCLPKGTKRLDHIRGRFPFPFRFRRHRWRS